MKRTQLYIDDALLRSLTILSREKKTTVSDLVRKALEKVYGRGPKNKKDLLQALHRVSGIWKNRQDLPATEDYVRSLRKDSRMKRFQVSSHG